MFYEKPKVYKVVAFSRFLRYATKVIFWFLLVTKQLMMTAKAFVNNINAMLDENRGSEHQSILSKMRIHPKQRQTSYRDELSSLINNYEMDGVEIGLIRFLGQYDIKENHMVFAHLEMDLLASDRQTREIVLLDHDNENYVMMKCCKNSTDFLQLLSVYAKTVIRTLVKKQTSELPDRKILFERNDNQDYKNFVDFLFPE